MKVLREGKDDIAIDFDDKNEGDGSWILSLIRRNSYELCPKIVSTLISKDLRKIPMNLSEARLPSDEKLPLTWIMRIEKAFNSISKES